jgi:hypothetical protein
MLGVVFIMNTFEYAINFCSNFPDQNTPKNGGEYYFESSNNMSFATEVQSDLFKPLDYGAIFYFTKFQKVLIDGVYENKYGQFAGYWYKNGTYRTRRIEEVKKLNDTQVLSIGLLP